MPPLLAPFQLSNPVPERGAQKLDHAAVLKCWQSASGGATAAGYGHDMAACAAATVAGDGTAAAEADDGAAALQLLVSLAWRNLLGDELAASLRAQVPLFTSPRPASYIANLCVPSRSLRPFSAAYQPFLRTQLHERLKRCDAPPRLVTLLVQASRSSLSSALSTLLAVELTM